MPYTKQYNLCSVPYSLAQPLFGFNCPGSIAVNGSGKSATKVQVVSQIHWAYSSPPSALQSIVYTRFTAAYRDIGREKIGTNKWADISAGPISQISADIYPLPDYYHIFAAADE